MDHHAYLNKKVAELTEDRRKDRSDESKTLLMRLKKTKLALKDSIARVKAKLTRYSSNSIIKTWTEITKQAEVIV